MTPFERGVTRGGEENEKKKVPLSCIIFSFR